MASVLYRLGRFAFHRRWLVTVAWLVVLGAALVGAVTLAKPTSGAFSIPGTPAQRTIDLLGERFPQASAGGATARIVFAAPAGHTLSEPRQQAAVERAVTRLRTAPQVATVTDPFQSKAINAAGTIGYAQASYAGAAVGLNDPAPAAPDA